jgi:hypothetical protein
MTTDVQDCHNCGRPIECDRVLWRWQHVGTDVRCASGNSLAQPTPRCPKCKSANYVFDQTDPWADYTRCGDCGFADRRSLGD